MATIILFDPSDSRPVEMDWSDVLGTAVITSALHFLPDPLTSLGGTNTTTSTFIGIMGAEHGKDYLIEASATLDLTNPDGSPQVLNRQFLLRCFNG